MNTRLFRWIGLGALHAGRLDGPVLVGLLLAVAARFEADTAAGLLPADAFAGEARLAALRLYR